MWDGPNQSIDSRRNDCDYTVVCTALYSHGCAPELLVLDPRSHMIPCTPHATCLPHVHVTRTRVLCVSLRTGLPYWLSYCSVQSLTVPQHASPPQCQCALLAASPPRPAAVELLLLAGRKRLVKTDITPARTAPWDITACIASALLQLVPALDADAPTSLALTQRIAVSKSAAQVEHTCSTSIAGTAKAASIL